MMYKIIETGTGKITEEVKLFTTMQDDLNSIPRIHIRKVRCDSYKLSSGFCTWPVVYAFPYMYKNK